MKYRIPLWIRCAILLGALFNLTLVLGYLDLRTAVKLWLQIGLNAAILSMLVAVVVQAIRARPAHPDSWQP